MENGETYIKIFDKNRESLDSIAVSTYEIIFVVYIAMPL